MPDPLYPALSPEPLLVLILYTRGGIKPGPGPRELVQHSDPYTGAFTTQHETHKIITTGFSPVAMAPMTHVGGNNFHANSLYSTFHHGQHDCTEKYICRF